MKIVACLIAVILSLGANGQTIELTMDSDVLSKVSAYNRSQVNNTTIQVYRIQFGVTSDRRAMETELANFENEFKIKTDWSQKGPYYYMKAGAYRTKLESYPDMMAIRARYGGAIYLVENVKKQFILE